MDSTTRWSNTQIPMTTPTLDDCRWSINGMVGYVLHQVESWSMATIPLLTQVKCRAPVKLSPTGRIGHSTLPHPFDGSEPGRQLSHVVSLSEAQIDFVRHFIQSNINVLVLVALRICTLGSQVASSKVSIILQDMPQKL